MTIDPGEPHARLGVDVVTDQKEFHECLLELHEDHDDRNEQTIDGDTFTHGDEDHGLTEVLFVFREGADGCRSSKGDGDAGTQ